MCELARAIVSSTVSSHMLLPDYYSSDVILPAKLFVSSDPVSDSFRVNNSSIFQCFDVTDLATGRHPA